MSGRHEYHEMPQSIFREEEARVCISRGGTREQMRDCPDTPLAGSNCVVVVRERPGLSTSMQYELAWRIHIGTPNIAAWQAHGSRTSTSGRGRRRHPGARRASS